MPAPNYESMGEYAALLKRYEEARKEASEAHDSEDAERFTEATAILNGVRWDIKEWLFEKVILERTVHLYFD